MAIEPTEADIGRKVIYCPGPTPHPRPFGLSEEGYITGFNEHYVFVRYGSDTGSKATRRDHLYWILK